MGRIEAEEITHPSGGHVGGKARIYGSPLYPSPPMADVPTYPRRGLHGRPLPPLMKSKQVVVVVFSGLRIYKLVEWEVGGEGEAEGREKERRGKQSLKKKRKSFSLLTLRISLMASCAMLASDILFKSSIFVISFFLYFAIRPIFLGTYFPSPSLNSEQGGISQDERQGGRKDPEEKLLWVNS